jgi:hypothetical protein
MTGLKDAQRKQTLRHVYFHFAGFIPLFWVDVGLDNRVGHENILSIPVI